MKDKIEHIVSSKQMIDQCVREMHQMLEDHGYFKFEIKQGSRSLNQNAMYWMWLEEIAKFINSKKNTDFTKDDMDLRMKLDFLGFTDEKKIGTEVIPPQLKSTTSLTGGEMHYYLTQIDMWAASFGLMLPRPDDCQYEIYKRKQVA